MSDLRVGRNDPCPCGSGRKFKHCCLKGRSDRAFPGFGYLPAPPMAAATARMASANGTARGLPLEPTLTVKVFQHERREWTDARLADVQPGQEFIAHNRLFRVLRPAVYAEDVLLDVAKIPEADRPYDPRNWRTPKSQDVVYAFGEDGQPTGHCLLGNLNAGQRCVFQGLIYHIKAGPTPETCTLVGHGEVDRRRRAPAASVWVEYTAQDALGKADIGYRYPLGRLISLTNGGVLPVEALRPGMHFLLEGSGVATVTKVDPPQLWPPADPEHDCFGNAPRDVVGTFQYTGWVQLIEMRCGGAVHHVSPGHLYWSETRRGWYPIGSFAVGELLRTRKGCFLPVESITPPQWKHTTVYNLEVDEYHTYFVGGGEEGVWAHNGMGPVGCGVPKAADARETLGGRLPQEGSNGTWVSGKPGEGVWRSTDIRARQAVAARTGGAVPEHVDITFRNGYPVFTEHIETLNGIKGSTRIALDTDATASLRTRTDRDFSAANKWLAEQWNNAGVKAPGGGEWTVTQVKHYLKDQGMQWHHHEDMTSMQLLRRDLHDNIPHIGGRSLMDFSFDPPLPFRKPK